MRYEKRAWDEWGVKPESRRSNLQMTRVFPVLRDLQSIIQNAEGEWSKVMRSFDTNCDLFWGREDTSLTKLRETCHNNDRK